MTQTNKQNINQEQTQMTLGLFLIILVLGFMIFFIVRQNISKINQVKAEVNTSQAELNSLNNKLTALGHAQEAYSEISDHITIIDEAIPNYSNIPQVMKILEKLATEVVDEGGPLIINSISVPIMPNDNPTTTNNTDSLLQSREVDIVISMNGDYQAVRDYIIKLKNLRHNFYLEKITFSSPQDSKGGFLSVSLNVKYYYFTKDSL